MTKYGLLAVMPALAFGSPAFAQQQLDAPSVPAVIEGAPTVATTGVAFHTDPVTGELVGTLVLPPSPNVIAPAVPSADVVWAPGHFTWSSDTWSYVWLPGRYVERVPARATWIAGHWVERPDGWIWVVGHWS